MLSRFTRPRSGKILRFGKVFKTERSRDFIISRSFEPIVHLRSLMNWSREPFAAKMHSGTHPNQADWGAANMKMLVV